MQNQQPLSQPADRDALRSEVEALASAGREALASQGGLEVYLAPAPSIAVVLYEIGRLRETTFREVGEGTGKAIDLDDYDTHYLHLFLWDPAAGKIAGAYRIGRTDTILAEFGPRGLATASGFEFEQPFLNYLNPGLELGRAFVSSDYQKSMYPLALLWKGIGAFITRYPRYHKLFGSVSISDDYTRVSKDLIVRFMCAKRRDAGLSRWVHPLHGYPKISKLPPAEDISQLLQSVEQVSAQIARTEPDGKGIPVLLRQYLKLNAVLLDFSVDPHFSNTLDALLLVDLKQAPRKMIRRYLGAEGCRALGR